MKKDVSRREFAKNLTKMLMFGGLTHFALTNAIGDSSEGLSTSPNCPGGRSDTDSCVLLVNEKGKRVETDVCPGGGPLEDVCNPEEAFADECPGEQMPEDECSPSGARSYENGLTDDECDSGEPISDLCAPVILPARKSDGTIEKDLNGNVRYVSSDQCISGMPADDECPEVGVDDKITDICHSGFSSHDNCAINPITQKEEGDNCPGGRASVDQCENDVGDACNPNGEHIEEADACKYFVSAILTDTCGPVGHPDKCPNGTNTEFGIGDDDACGDYTTKYLDGGWASDDCHDGSVEQDICEGHLDNMEGRDQDVCLPTAMGEATTDDKCEPVKIPEDNDECYHGLPLSDKCLPDLGDKDECPGGGSDVDECYTGMPEDDECPGGKSDVDVCFAWRPETDECVKTGAVSGQDNEPSGGEDFVE